MHASTRYRSDGGAALEGAGASDDGSSLNGAGTPDDGGAMDGAGAACGNWAVGAPGRIGAGCAGIDCHASGAA